VAVGHFAKVPMTDLTPRGLTLKGSRPHGASS